MASKTGNESIEDVGELLDTVDKNLDRVKTLYEQYFLGMQKQPPTHLHNDVERKLRDLTQMQIRNTGLRYRFATLQQKFGSYNSYWRRTLRQIENGTYLRNLSKIGREAVRTGSAIPEEILAAMPKRMRDQVIRDRDQALAIAKRRKKPTTNSDLLPPEPGDEVIAMIKEPTELRRAMQTRNGAHVLDESDSDLDIDAFFAAVQEGTIPPPLSKAPANAAQLASAVGAAKPVVSAPGAAKPAVTPPPPSGPQLPRLGAAVPAAGAQTPSGPPRPGAGAPIPPGGQPSAQPRAASPASAASARPGVAAPGTPSPAAPSVPQPPRVGTASPPASMPPGMPRPSSPPVATRATGAMPAIAPPAPPASPPGATRATGAMPALAPPPPPSATRATGAMPALAPPPGATRATGAMPAIAPPGSSRVSGVSGVPGVPPRQPTAPQGVPAIPRPASSQQSRPNPIAPGSAAAHGPVEVESMSGPFPRVATPAGGTPVRASTPAGGAPSAPKRPTPAPAGPPQRPPPGMTDADVNALYAKYIKAKEMVGEKIGPGEHSKLLKTINAQAPKIMEQYKAKAVDFSVVVKDNQVIIRAKPKT